MAVYRYRFFDLATNRDLGDLPLSDVSFSRSINEVGELTAKLVLTDPAKVPGWRVKTQRRKTCVYVDRDGVLVWGGIVTQRRPNDDGTQADIVAKGFEWYLMEKRELRDDFEASADQFTIVRQLVAYMQSKPRGNIGLTVSPNVSGVVRDVAYSGIDRNKIGELIRKLAEVEDGFEFTIQVYYDSNGQPAKHLVLARELGNANARLPLSYPGNVMSHPEWAEDGSEEVNSLTALGAGEGSAKLLADAVAVEASAELAAGYVLYEGTMLYQDETDEGLLQSRANDDLRWSVVGQVVPKVTVRGGMHPMFGTYALGDTFALRVTSPYFPANPDGSPSVEGVARCFGWSVSTPDDNVTLNLGEVRDA